MNWKIIGRSLKNGDMRKRIFAVLGMLLVFRMLAYVPVPLSNPETLRQVLTNLFNSENTPQFLSFINVLSGGALANFSIMLAGLGPYINASIIMQLLTKALPRLEALQKEGESGQKKINQYTRMLTFPLAIIQSIGSIYLIKETAQQIGGVGNVTGGGLSEWILLVAALTGGSMLLMWLGEQITEKGIGNGISLVITVGIVSRVPQTLKSLIQAIAGKHPDIKLIGTKLPLSWKELMVGAIVSIGLIILTLLVVKLNESSRQLTVHYAKRVQGNRTYGGVTTVLPVKLISAGVIPIIFAVAFLSVPSFGGQLLSGSGSPHLQHIGTRLLALFQPPTAQSFAAGGWQPFLYPVVYFLLVFVFTFFYTSVTFNSKEIAENLQKQGGFLEGVRGGKQTEKYLSKVVNRVTLFGAVSLGLLALLPVIGQVFVSVNISIGGTSILILVAVALETLRAIESRALMVTYDQYSEPDFFYEAETAAEAATGSRRLRFGQRLKLRKK